MSEPLSMPLSSTNLLSSVATSDHWEGPGAWWPIFPLMWLLVIGAIITTVVLVGKRRSRVGPVQAGQSRLAERFAAGEIDEQEYRERLAVLKEQL